MSKQRLQKMLKKAGLASTVEMENNGTAAAMAAKGVAFANNQVDIFPVASIGQVAPFDDDPDSDGYWGKFAADGVTPYVKASDVQYYYATAYDETGSTSTSPDYSSVGDLGILVPMSCREHAALERGLMFDYDKAKVVQNEYWVKPVTFITRAQYDVLRPAFEEATFVLNNVIFNALNGIDMPDGSVLGENEEHVMANVSSFASVSNAGVYDDDFHVSRWMSLPGWRVWKSKDHMKEYHALMTTVMDKDYIYDLVNDIHSAGVTPELTFYVGEGSPVHVRLDGVGNRELKPVYAGKITDNVYRYTSANTLNLLNTLESASHSVNRSIYARYGRPEYSELMFEFYFNNATELENAWHDVYLNTKQFTLDRTPEQFTSYVHIDDDNDDLYVDSDSISDIDSIYMTESAGESQFTSTNAYTFNWTIPKGTDNLRMVKSALSNTELADYHGTFNDDRFSAGANGDYNMWTIPHMSIVMEPSIDSIKQYPRCSNYGEYYGPYCYDYSYDDYIYKYASTNGYCTADAGNAYADLYTILDGWEKIQERASYAMYASALEPDNVKNKEFAVPAITLPGYYASAYGGDGYYSIYIGIPIYNIIESLWRYNYDESTWDTRIINPEIPEDYWLNDMVSEADASSFLSEHGSITMEGEYLAFDLDSFLSFLVSHRVISSPSVEELLLMTTKYAYNDGSSLNDAAYVRVSKTLPQAYIGFSYGSKTSAHIDTYNRYVRGNYNQSIHDYAYTYTSQKMYNSDEQGQTLDVGTDRARSMENVYKSPSYMAMALRNNIAPSNGRFLKDVVSTVNDMGGLLYNDGYDDENRGFKREFNSGLAWSQMVPYACNNNGMYYDVNISSYISSIQRRNANGIFTFSFDTKPQQNTQVAWPIQGSGISLTDMIGLYLYLINNGTALVNVKSKAHYMKHSISSTSTQSPLDYVQSPYTLNEKASATDYNMINNVRGVGAIADVGYGTSPTFATTWNDMTPVISSVYAGITGATYGTVAGGDVLHDQFPGFAIDSPYVAFGRRNGSNTCLNVQIPCGLYIAEAYMLDSNTTYSMKLKPIFTGENVETLYPWFGENIVESLLWVSRANAALVSNRAYIKLTNVATGANMYIVPMSQATLNHIPVFATTNTGSSYVSATMTNLKSTLQATETYSDSSETGLYKWVEGAYFYITDYLTVSSPLTPY